MKLVGVLIAYNPNIELLEKNINSYMSDLNKLIIVNNSSYSLEKKIKFSEEVSKKIEIINLFDNMGIAKAQNIGMEKAYNDGADYVLQLDQDSIFEEKGVTNLLSSFESLLKNGIKVGILGPSIDNYSNYNKKTIKEKTIKEKRMIVIENRYYKKVKEIISSGALISKEAYTKVGGVMEELFIDYVDTEYCWRIKKMGFEVIQDLNVRLFHSIGNGKIKYKGKEYIVSAPVRNYYQTRNELYLLKYQYVPLNWKRDAIKRIIRRVFLFKKIMPDGDLRKCYIIKGIKDFFSKKMGKIDSEF